MTVYEDAKSGKYTAHRQFGGDPTEWEAAVKGKRDELKNDLEKEFQLEDHPKKDDLFTSAKQYAHSTDAATIAEAYAELVPLLMPVAYRAWKHLQECLNELAFLDDQDHKPENPSKMYKLHLALAGQLPGYRSDIDAALALMEGLKKPNLPTEAEEA